MFQHERLKKLVYDKSITCKDLSKIAGRSMTTVWRYMNGMIVPPDDVVLALAKGLDTSVEYLKGKNDCVSSDYHYSEVVDLIKSNCSNWTPSQCIELRAILERRLWKRG